MMFWAKPFEIEIEDFGTGWIDRTTAANVVEAVRRSWHLAWSRTR
jgi:hypothetical protein